MQEIAIKCSGSKYIPIGNLKNFQGNLKELKTPEFNQIKKSLIKHGFTFPVFVWGDYILDGHQRIFVMKQLLNKGYHVGDIPVVEIEAIDQKEAAEKLLLINSKFARMTDEGLYEFASNFDLDMADIGKDLNLPDINMEKFMKSWGVENTGSGKGEGDGAGKDKIDEKFGIYIECETEEQQQELLERLTEDGIECKALIS